MAGDARSILGHDEVRRLGLATRALDLVPVNAPASAIFDALREIAPIAAGTYSVLDPDDPSASISEPYRLPDDLFQAWIGTPRDVLARVVEPVLTSPEGGLRRDAEAISPKLRERFPAIQLMSEHGFGEGAGYHAMVRSRPGRSAEHVMLALIAERGARFSAQEEVMLSALGGKVRDALLRARLPLLARHPLHHQVVEERRRGFVLLRESGAPLEANRRAHELAQRYGRLLGAGSRRNVLFELVERVRQRCAKGRPLAIKHPKYGTVLDAYVHRLSARTNHLGDDALLVELYEIELPVGGPSRPLRVRLTARQLQIAELNAAGYSAKEIGEQVGISTPTVNKHLENIHRALGVRSQRELARFFRKGQG